MSWIAICRQDDITPEAMRAFVVGDRRVAIYHVGGQVYATDNVCSHAFALLTDGWLDGTVVECPLHAAQFDITSGAVLSGPAACAIRTYETRIVDGAITIDLP